ncbi:MAG: NAD-dependent epimerase/dehydratase family protein [Elusimicrobia bacterium]|nr:NAD-dependent epimerase/dehydratase family protein [Candidatus Obscuribacterium magneticum]
MKILVTGGAGFIGSNIVDEYIRQGHRVWVVDDLSTGHRRYVPKAAVLFHLNIRNKSRLLSLFKKARFDVVNHHAAQMDVRHSVADPQFDANVNIIGTLNLLEAAKNCKVKKFIFSSSGGTIYGECRRPAREGDPEIPLAPYGIAKLSSEKYIHAYAVLYGLKYTILRYANVYGPRQDPFGEAGVVAIFSNKILSGERPFIFGTGKQTRDFVYVGDVVRANTLALFKGHNKILNIGTGLETSVVKLWRTTASLSHSDLQPIYKRARSGELSRSFLNCQKAKRDLGWAPQTDLRDGLERTLIYFKEKLKTGHPR